MSIPLIEATAIWTPIYSEGLVCSSLFDHGYGKNVEGLHSENLQKKHGNWENETLKSNRDQIDIDVVIMFMKV